VSVEAAHETLIWLLLAAVRHELPGIVGGWVSAGVVPTGDVRVGVRFLPCRCPDG